MINIKYYLLTADFWTLILSLLLLGFPSALGHRESPVVRLAFFSPILIVISKNIFYLVWNSIHKIHKIHFNRLLLVLFIIYAGVESVAFIRAVLSNSFSTSAIMGSWLIWFSFALFGLLAFSNVNNVNVLQRFREAIYYSLILYVSLNAILNILGYKTPQVLYTSLFPSVMLKSIGIIANRVLFPTASGINTFGIIAGAAIVASSVLFFSSPNKIDRILGLLGIGLGVYGILLSDSRGAFLFALLTVLLSFPTFRIFTPFLRWLAVLIPLLPYTLIFALRFVPQSLSEILNRSSSSQGVESNLSGRFVIWDAVLDNFNNFRFTHLFGFGYRGQVVSGISREYSHLFVSYLDAEMAGAHNFLLQTLLDTGYIGALIAICLITALLFVLGAHLKNNQDHTVKILFFLLVYLVFAGVTETVLTPNHQELFAIFMLIWAAAGSLPKQE